MIESTDPLDQSIARMKAVWAATRLSADHDVHPAQEPVVQVLDEAAEPSEVLVIPAAENANDSATLVDAPLPTSSFDNAPITAVALAPSDKTFDEPGAYVPSPPLASETLAAWPALSANSAPIADPLPPPPPPIPTQRPSLWRRFIGIFGSQ